MIVNSQIVTYHAIHGNNRQLSTQGSEVLAEFFITSWMLSGIILLFFLVRFFMNKRKVMNISDYFSDITNHNKHMLKTFVLYWFCIISIIFLITIISQIIFK